MLYVIFFALLGGLMGEYALKTRAWRWFGLLLPIAGLVLLIQQRAFPYSPHVEWPASQPRNAWVSAFRWIRENSPKDAVVALDPGYMLQPGDDQHGFRAIAERSALAEAVKDSGAVSLFPNLAASWKAQVQAQSGWASFQLQDFERLARRYPVTWVVTRSPAPAGLVCQYSNEELSVCRIDMHPEATVR